MIEVSALKHFEQIWRIFDKRLFDARGSMFTVEPFEQFLTQEYANSLSEESARIRFHQDLLKWGKIERYEHKIGIIDEVKFPDGEVIPQTGFIDREVPWARRFIFRSFYNLCSVAAFKESIDELIVQSIRDKSKPETGRKRRWAFQRLIGISNVFLTAEWAREIIVQGVSNDATDFFKGVSSWMNRDIPRERFDVARNWLGTTMLWYLGGRDMRPRREFMLVLRDYDLVSRETDEPSFNAQLSKLHLL